MAEPDLTGLSIDVAHITADGRCPRCPNVPSTCPCPCPTCSDDARGPVEMPEHQYHEPCRACGHLCSHCPHPCPPTPGEVRGPEAHPERDPDVLHLELDALREELQRLRQRPTVEDLARRLHDHDLDPARTGEWGDLVAAWQERYRTLARAALEAMP